MARPLLAGIPAASSCEVSCASSLAQRGVLLVGTDCPSADDIDSKTLDVHHALLDHGVCVLKTWIFMR